MNFRRGKTPARPDAIKMKFGAYFKAPNLPVPPVRFGRPWLIRNWGMLGNDRWSDCVWAGGMHETMMLRIDASDAVPLFTTSNALADYGAATGFKASDPATDEGTDIQEAAAYRQKTGLVDAGGVRHKIDVYTELHAGDLEQLALSTFLLGVSGVGVNLPDNAERQFDNMEVWDVEPNSPGGDGHYISCVGRNSVGNFLFVSWGRLQAATPAWVRAYMDEGLCYVSRERLKASGLSPQGFDLARLEDDYKELTA